MKKNIRTIIILLSLGYLVYFSGTIIWSLGGYFSKKNRHDFSYVTKKTEVTNVDSFHFAKHLISDLIVDYTSEFNDGRYLTSFTYLNDYRFIIRKLNAQKVDLLVDYNPIFEKNTTDLLIKYDIEEVFPFFYKIDVERNNYDNKHIIIDGKGIEIIKRTKDTLLIHGKIYNISFGTHNKYVNEGIYLQDETFYKKPIEVELLIFNRENELFEYILFPINKQSLHKGLVEKIGSR